MNLLLNEYTDNPVIDEVVYWPPKDVRKIVAKRKPLGIEVEFSDNTKHFTPFKKAEVVTFLSWWREAQEILSMVTNIDLVDEISSESVDTYSEELAQTILKRREELINECITRLRGHENDEFTKSWFTEQFGFNFANLPKHIEEIVQNAQ